MSARNPVNMWLVRNTSFNTSLEMFSTVPGLVRPRVARRSWKDWLSDPKSEVIGFPAKEEEGEEEAGFSSATAAAAVDMADRRDELSFLGPRCCGVR